MTKWLLGAIILLVIIAGVYVYSRPEEQMQTDKNAGNDQQRQEPKTYTLAEVAAHNIPQDCWLVLNGKVYNVSGFGDTQHPGRQAVYQGCGKDATSLFETRPMGSNTPHSDRARDLLPNFYIGDLR